MSNLLSYEVGEDGRYPEEYFQYPAIRVYGDNKYYFMRCPEDWKLIQPVMDAANAKYRASSRWERFKMNWNCNREQKRHMKIGQKTIRHMYKTKTGSYAD